jgi:hypothetical protein
MVGFWPQAARWKPAAGIVQTSYEAWRATDPIRGDVRVTITGPNGFERRAAFSVDEDPGEITRRVRETIEEY